MSTNDPTHISTGGGAYVAGDVTAARNFIGRDLNISLQLQDVDDAAKVASLVAALTEGDPESQSVRTDLLSLMKELRRTHATLVDLVSPLRRVKNDLSTFGDDFEAVYADFRDMYDAHDFEEARTRCHRIRRIGERLERHQVPVTKRPEWGQMRQDLVGLYDSDQDLIEAYYVPFIRRFNNVMVKIHQHVDQQEIAQAITLKRVFLDELAPQYGAIKEKLRFMDDVIADIEASLD